MGDKAIEIQRKGGPEFFGDEAMEIQAIVVPEFFLILSVADCTLWVFP